MTPEEIEKKRIADEAAAEKKRLDDAAAAEKNRLDGIAAAAKKQQDDTASALQKVRDDAKKKGLVAMTVTGKYGIVAVGKEIYVTGKTADHLEARQVAKRV